MKLLYGDCLELMKDIPDKSVDMVLCDLPYGTTACKWDSIIPFDELWEQYKRVVKKNGVLALFAQEPFATLIRSSNLSQWKYDWIWEKPQGTNFLSSKTQPLKNYEIITVFANISNETIANNELFDGLKEYFYSEKDKSGLSSKEIKIILGNQMGSHYFTHGIQWSLPTEKDYKKLQSTGYFKRSYKELKDEYEKIKSELDCSTVIYYPQMSEGRPYTCKHGKMTELVTGNNAAKKTGVLTVNKGFRYPKSIIKMNPVKNSERLHPTQKPVSLLEYLIKTYTNEGETVLDNCMGSGSTGVACVNTGRNFIGMELDEKYFEIAKQRIGGN